MTATATRLFLLCLLIPFLLVVRSVSQSAPRKPTPQQMPPSAYKLIAVKVRGTKRYTQDEVIAASGLRMGATVDEDDFRKAAKELSDSGAFTDVAYSFSYSSAGTNLELQVADSVQFLPAHFDDFVWFTDEQLRQKIQERVPLFKGELPISGRLPEQVSDVLQALLVENSVAGHVDYLRNNGPNGKVESISYSVSDVLIRVQNLEFTGAGSSELPLLQAVGKRLPDHEYSRNRMNAFVEHQLLPVFYAHGYLKASFAQPQPKVIKQSAPDTNDDPRNLTLVDVILHVDPGAQYTLTQINWSGNHEFPAEKLQGLLHAQFGQPVNLVRLAADLEEVKNLYGSHGYLNATITPQPQLDNSAQSVSYTLEVQEDHVYHMGDLEFRGVDNTLASKLRAAWKLRQGDVYDSSYLKQFLAQSGKLLPANFDWGIETHVTPNSHDKSVDVEIHYTVKAPQ